MTVAVLGCREVRRETSRVLQADGAMAAYLFHTYAASHLQASNNATLINYYVNIY